MLHVVDTMKFYEQIILFGKCACEELHQYTAKRTCTAYLRSQPEIASGGSPILRF